MSPFPVPAERGGGTALLHHGRWADPLRRPHPARGVSPDQPWHPALQAAALLHLRGPLSPAPPAPRGMAGTAQLATARHHQHGTARRSLAPPIWRSLAQPGTTGMVRHSPAWGGRIGASSAQHAQGRGRLLHRQTPALRPGCRLCPRGPGVPALPGTPTLKHFLPPTRQHQPQASPSVPVGAWHSSSPGQVGLGVPSPRSGVPGGGGGGG